MRFLRRNKYPLVFVAVLAFASVMVVSQFLSNQSAHVELREDFILLMERGEGQPATRLYQLLIQELPALSEKALVDDLQRTNLLLANKTPSKEDLLWKYQVSVNNELNKRSDKRIARARARGEIP